jgi:hypothetical protein
MHVVDSIRIILMLLSYVMQKTGRLTFEEKCKILQFVGKLTSETTFEARLPSNVESVRVYRDQVTHLLEST